MALTRLTTDVSVVVMRDVGMLREPCAATVSQAAHTGKAPNMVTGMKCRPERGSKA